MPDENKTQPESIEITLAGRQWHLRLRTRELVLIERTFHGQVPPVNPLELIDQLVIVDEGGGTWKLGSLFALQALLWAALRREDPTLTFDDTADLIDTFQDGNLAELAMLVRLAWSVGGLGSARPVPKNAEAEATGMQH